VGHKTSHKEQWNYASPTTGPSCSCVLGAVHAKGVEIVFKLKAKCERILIKHMRCPACRPSCDKGPPYCLSLANNSCTILSRTRDWVLGTGGPEDRKTDLIACWKSADKAAVTVRYCGWIMGGPGQRALGHAHCHTPVGAQNVQATQNISEYVAGF